MSHEVSSMHKSRDDWGLGDFADFFSCELPGIFGFRAGSGRQRSHRRRNQMFESGEVKFVMLRLLKEKPRHGYEIIKALEERLAGCYTPSAGNGASTLPPPRGPGYRPARE